MWRAQLFNYIAFTVALIVRYLKEELPAFHQLAAIHLTYMNLISALVGSELVHPTYFGYNPTVGLSEQRAWKRRVLYNLALLVGGTLPILVCLLRMDTTMCTSADGQTLLSMSQFRWIIFFVARIPGDVDYTLFSILACGISSVHILFTLVPDTLPDANNSFIHVLEPALRGVAHFYDEHRQRAKDMAVAVFFVYWAEEIIAIEWSLVSYFGHLVNGENSWGFGQVSSFHHIQNVLVECEYSSPYQILSFVLLYPSVEALWNHVIYPAVRGADRSSSGSGDGGTGTSSIVWAEPESDEKYGHEQDITEVSIPRSKDTTHPLYRMVSPESTTSFPSTLARSSLPISNQG